LIATSWHLLTSDIEFGNSFFSISVFRCNFGRRGKDVTKAPIIPASRARIVLFVASSLLAKAALNVGSCGIGTRGCIYVKKSSTRSWRVSSEQIDSPEIVCDSDSTSE
jgi:hypothetical protein